MDIAIVTGASSSLGLAISRRLIELGFRVYGLGGDYTDCSLNNVNFRPLPCDLSDPVGLEKACQQILDKEKGVYLIVNNAKFFGRTAFSEMSTAEMEQVLRINLLCPLILARFFSESLKEFQGYLIQLGSPHAESASGGAVGAAASGGLKWMGEQLFSEFRNHGVKVCHLSPEPNRVADARKRIRRGARTEAAIDPEAVAQAVEQILQSPFGNVVTEMILRPLRIDEPDQEPVRKVPYPEPQPIPYTVPREFIEAEEQLEEEEWKKQQEKRKQRRQAAKKATKDKEPAKDKRDDSGKARKTRKPAQSKPIEKKPDPEKRESGEKEEGSKPRRRSRRKPRPPRVEVGFLDDKKAEGDSPQGSGKPGEKVATKQAKKAPRKKQQRKPDSKPAQEKPSAETPKDEKNVASKGRTRKTAAKKATATKKSAKKATKKAAKKVARKRAAKKSAKSSDTGKESA
jgi:NAD(P)-dependent dehydrogenase (short-subunit alcohol dehydrogenase family)